MRQLSLLQPTPPAPRPPDLDAIRKHLLRALHIARDAEILPWSEGEASRWEKQFPELAALLPAEEGRELVCAFNAEIERLKAGR